jgi:DeoR family galactitol utilization operon repressor
MKLDQFERKKEIIALLTADPAVTVRKISEMLGFSAATIRSDLASLESQGLLLRVRGGATSSFHPEILRRQKSRREQKNRIARKAASLVEDGDTIMVEAGTTTALIAKFLTGKRNIRIVTNSTLLIPYARSNPGIHVSVIGGTFRPETESLVGPMALAALESFYVRLAFVGTDGFSLKHGLSSHVPEAAAVLKKICERAETTVLMADSTKYGKTGFVSILPLSSVEVLITDSEIVEEAFLEIENQGVNVLAV